MNVTSEGSPPGPRIFITYRREETGAHAGRLYDALAVRFAEDNVFMDVDLAPGVDFVKRIGEAVGACHVLIVVMGPNWATVKDESGIPRLADPEDFVRLEVETALRRPEVTPIPVLVAGAKMPDRDELPPEIQAITRRNALELSDLRWRQDVGRLISTLDELLSEMSPLPGPPSPVPGITADKRAPVTAQPEETAPSSTIASGKPVVGDWVRRHLPITIAAAVIAIAGLVWNTDVYFRMLRMLPCHIFSSATHRRPVRLSRTRPLLCAAMATRFVSSTRRMKYTASTRTLERIVSSHRVKV